MLLVTKWNRRAINQFVKAIEYIKEESLQNAEKVQSDILAAISSRLLIRKNFLRININ